MIINVKRINDAAGVVITETSFNIPLNKQYACTAIIMNADASAIFSSG